MNGGKNDLNHPVLYVLGLAMSAFMLVGLLPLVIWLCSSIFLPTGYHKWVLDSESAINEQIFAFQFGLGNGESFALTQASLLTETLLPGIHKAGVHRQRPRARIRRQDDQDMASQLSGQFYHWMEETFVPVQRFYLPLVMVRSLILLGAVLAFLLPFLASTYRGQAERRRRVQTGSLLKPHRFFVYKTLLALFVSLLFAYPVYPVPIPALLFFPVMGVAIHLLGHLACANMMEL